MTPLEIAEAASGRPDFHVVNRKGVTLYTSSDRARATAWCKSASATMPGLEVQEVEITVRRRRVYRPRPAVAQGLAGSAVTA